MNIAQLTCLGITAILLLGWLIWLWNGNELAQISNKWDRQRLINRALLYLRSVHSIDTHQDRINYLTELNPLIFHELVLRAFPPFVTGSQFVPYPTTPCPPTGVYGTKGEKIWIQTAQTLARPRKEELDAFCAYCQACGVQGYYVFLGCASLTVVKRLAILDSVRLVSGQRLLDSLPIHNHPPLGELTFQQVVG